VCVRSEELAGFCEGAGDPPRALALSNRDEGRGGAGCAAMRWVEMAKRAARSGYSEARLILGTVIKSDRAF
jgi:hypothetical protein